MNLNRLHARTAVAGRRMFRLLLACCAMNVAASAAASSDTSPPIPVMTIGQGQAWVRTFFAPSGQREIDELVWTNPPIGMEADTLWVWSPKRPAPLSQWQWIDASDAVSPPAAVEGSEEELLRWSPTSTALIPGKAPDRALRLSLAAPLSDAMGHSLTFRLPGLNWTATYHVIVRGLSAASMRSAQVDMTGSVLIQNDTSSAWPEVELSFAGSEDSRDAVSIADKPPGLLALDRDSPLTALWFGAEQTEPPVPAFYPLRLRAALPALGATEVTFVRIERKPAQVIHAYSADDIPFPTISEGLPLERILRVANTAELGLGFPLLPGRVELMTGMGSRHVPLRTIAIPYTPFPGTMRLSLGPVQGLRAARASGPATDLPDGSRLMDFSITFINDLEGEAEIHAIELPPVASEWDLVRASIPCTSSGGTLQFDLILPGHSQRTFTYRLRLPTPPSS